MTAIKYKSGYKYKLVEKTWFNTNIYPSERVDTPFIFLLKDGTLKIKAGYAWDGPSGPTIDTLNSMRASLLHDALYQLLRMKKISGESNRRKADKAFYLILREDGMWKLRAKIWWRAVRRWAKHSSIKGRKVHTAP